MSSSDQVRVTFKKETTMGELEPAGNLGTCRILTDELSGTPRTIPTDEVTGDRMGTGQDVVGMDIGGGFGVKLSPDPFHDAMLEAGMMMLWTTQVDEVIELIFDVTAGTITKAGGTDFTTIFTARDMLTITGMTSAVNNGMVYVVSTAADVLTVLFPDEMIDETGTGATISLSPYLEVSNEEITYSFIKDFLDLTSKSISYYGQKSNGFDFNFTFGEHVTGNYNFAGTAWDAPVTPDSDGQTIDPIGTETLLNASQDVGLVVLDGAKVDFCIKTLNIALDNGLNPQECIGYLAPTDQIPGDASITVAMEAYLVDTNFDMVRDKMDNTAVSIAYYALNSNGLGYAFQIPAVQLSFPDPVNEGKGSQTMLNMEGVAKKDVSFGNILRIYQVN